MNSSKTSKNCKKKDQQQTQQPPPCSTKEEEPILLPQPTLPVSHDQLTLRPVCVAFGDAIFITVEHNGEKLAYLVDGSTKTNEKMLKTTYAELKGEGFPLRYVIVTHPDQDHYSGIGRVLDWVKDQKPAPQVLLTNRFGETIKKKNFVEQYIPVQSFPSELPTVLPISKNEYFKVSHKSFTSDLVLYRMKETNEPGHPIDIPNQDDTKFEEAEDDHDNESSIITTITTKNDGNTILACLTGDAFFKTSTSKKRAKFLQDQKIIVFQVPHHGSELNSKFEFYEEIAENTQYYLISCGHHGRHCFPRKEVFTAIRDATVKKNKKGATIVLTDGTNLNGEKVSSFTGHDHEPSISYWDPHLKKDSDCELINKDFLQFTFSGKGNLVDDQLQNVIQWSITGYKQMAYSYGSKKITDSYGGLDSKQITWCRIRIHLKALNNCHLQVEKGELKTEKCLGKNKKCTTSIDGYIGLPAPTDPCTWDNRVIMVDGTNDLVFLQLATGERIIKEQTYNDAQSFFEKKYNQILKLRKADGYEKVVPHLIKALTDVIFGMKTTAAKKVEMIVKVEEAFTDQKTFNKLRTFGDGGEATDSIMTLVQIAREIIEAIHNKSLKYDQGIYDKIDAVKKEGLSSPEPPQSITSLDEEFVVFKCVDVPWKIAYGTINDNGEVNWGVLNTLKTSTDAILMTVFKPKYLS